MNRIFYFFIFVALVCVCSCTDEVETIDESTFGYDYLPLTQGRSYTYESDSVLFANNGAIKDTLHSFLKEVIGDTYVDDAGQEVFKLYRYFKRNLADEWTRTNTWTAYSQNNTLIRTEENIKFVKLVFPIQKGLKWNGNVFLDEDLKVTVAGETIEMYKNWDYKLESINESYFFNGDSIPAIKVNLVDESSIIDRRKAIEYYGKGIGLLKKELIILDTDGSQPSAAWEDKADKGFIHTLTLIEVQ